MSKIFVNENPRGPSPAVVVAKPASYKAQEVAKVFTVLAVLAMTCGIGVLLYHYWKLALAVLLSMVVFACWSSRVAFFGCMCVVALVLAILGNSARAQSVADGDTLKRNGTIYRLWGIDAPETKQWCNGYPDGVIATGTLEKLIKSKTVVCEPKTTDRYGRTVAICRANGEDLGRAMVQLGMALAFTRYSADYVQDEAKAKAARPGRPNNTRHRAALRDATPRLRRARWTRSWPRPARRAA
jgi:endonuclease YncB( thermonuclease family)